MTTFLDDLRRWRIASGETQALLDRNHELLDRRAQLLRSAAQEFRSVVRIAREFAEDALLDQEPAARSDSPRSR